MVSTEVFGPGEAGAKATLKVVAPRRQRRNQPRRSHLELIGARPRGPHPEIVRLVSPRLRITNVFAPPVRACPDRRELHGSAAVLKAGSGRLLHGDLGLVPAPDSAKSKGFSSASLLTIRSPVLRIPTPLGTNVTTKEVEAPGSKEAAIPIASIWKSPALPPVFCTPERVSAALPIFRTVYPGSSRRAPRRRNRTNGMRHPKDLSPPDFPRRSPGPSPFPSEVMSNGFSSPSLLTIRKVADRAPVAEGVNSPPRRSSVLQVQRLNSSQ